MNLSEEVRKLSRETNVNLSEIARRTGQSPANLSKKLNKETLSFEDFEKILEVLGVKMDCGFILPGQKTAERTGLDRRTESRIAILEKELEVERMKNDYYRSNGFVFRTAMETLFGSLSLLENHGKDPARVKSCTERMRIALDQLMSITEDEDILSGRKVSAEAKEKPILSSTGVKRILVVDDNAINRDIVTDLLNDSGLEAEEASDGKEALEKLKAAEAGYFDLVLMDLQMPKMDGFEAAKAVRKLEGANRAVTIIAMTAGDSDDDREKASEAGMNGFIQKPLNLRKLFDILNDR